MLSILFTSCKKDPVGNQNNSNSNNNTSTKGILKIEAISEWTVSKKIFNDSLKIIKLPDVDTIKLN
jgi:hypothetical protein